MTLTVDEARLPAALRGANRVGRGLERVGWRPLPVDPAIVLRRAQRLTGLSDVGDPWALESFERLARAFDSTAKLSLFGRLSVRIFLENRMESRLKVIEALRGDPAIADVPITRPIFIVGLPRTGTTLLHQLLDATGEARAPCSWETFYPAPPPRPGDREDPRIARVDREFYHFHRLAPQMRAMHPLATDSPDECLMLLGNAFANPMSSMLGTIPEYMTWLKSQDLTPGYQFHKLQLQVLARHVETPRWVLKTPAHLLALDALLTVYPDACVIQTHRDPLRSVPSICSLIGTTHRVYSDDVDLAAVGRAELERWADGLERALEIRAGADPAQFFDLHYAALLADPVGVLRQIHARFALPWSDAAEARVRAHLAANPQHRHGKHRYALERFDLTDDDVRARMAGYCEAFGVAPER
ncbi:MAG: sulfotransferase [Myxococcales bacterium]|nr:sulfotransferase [Myxococcales bacterium]